MLFDVVRGIRNCVLMCVHGHTLQYDVHPQKKRGHITKHIPSQQKNNNNQALININCNIIPYSLDNKEFDGIVQFLVQPTKGQEDHMSTLVRTFLAIGCGDGQRRANLTLLCTLMGVRLWFIWQYLSSFGIYHPTHQSNTSVTCVRCKRCAFARL